MQGCAKDDSLCLRSPDDLKKLILKVGFLPLFGNTVKGFSAEERTPSGNWWTGDPSSDPWEWRRILAKDPDIAYGKFFERKAGFISKEWFPVFANYRRNGYDFDALYEDGLAPYRQKKLMDVFLPDDRMTGRRLLSYEIKEFAGFGKGGEKNFEGVMTDLQMEGYLLMGDFRQKLNKKGRPYGWHIAEMETPETKWGYEWISSGYKEDPSASFDRIIRHLGEVFPESDKRVLQKALRFRRPGDENPDIAASGTALKERKAPGSAEPQMPYPENLITEIGLDLVFDNTHDTGAYRPCPFPFAHETEKQRLYHLYPERSFFVNSSVTLY